MDILKKLNNIFKAPSPKLERALYLYVQCDRCGEKMRARVDMWNELTPEYDEKGDDAASYHCRKVLIGEKLCFQPIELSLRFNKNHKLIGQEIKGGKFIEEEEYESDG
jgi:hypothetical protein